LLWHAASSRNARATLILNYSAPGLELRRGVRSDDLALAGIIAVLARDRDRAGRAVDIDLRVVERRNGRAGADRARIGDDILQLEPSGVAAVDARQHGPRQADSIVAAEQSNIDLI